MQSSDIVLISSCATSLNGFGCAIFPDAQRATVLWEGRCGSRQQQHYFGGGAPETKKIDSCVSREDERRCAVNAR
jgi:hypothetical protein